MPHSALGYIVNQQCSSSGPSCFSCDLLSSFSLLASLFSLAPSTPFSTQQTEESFPNINQIMLFSWLKPFSVFHWLQGKVLPLSIGLSWWTASCFSPLPALACVTEPYWSLLVLTGSLPCSHNTCTYHVCCAHLFTHLSLQMDFEILTDEFYILVTFVFPVPRTESSRENGSEYWWRARMNKWAASSDLNSILELTWNFLVSGVSWVSSDTES